MPTKSVILTIIVAAMLFGGVISGCNRNRDSRVAMNNDRRQPRADGRRPAGQPQAPRGVRPAEVLSASVKRRSAEQHRRYSPTPTMASAPYSPQPMAYRQPNNYAQQPIYTVSTSKIHEPLPEPIPLPNAPVYAGPVMYAGPTYYHAEPTYSSEPYVQELMPLSTTPELAMARASLEPIQVPTTYIPQVQPIQVPPPVMRQDPAMRAPLPELEPVRYHRTANAPANTPVTVPIMMSTAPARRDTRDRQEMQQRALAPLAQPTAGTTQNWVASPTTAFRF